ncbi:enoyl-CoA hydratase-related protein [Dyella acidisoli]|uniref:Enoyl-CoA hydratase n=1 Tax=Dyella acidisoli TaxID=1867834 RepID=A0ABQ5XIS4_9GAMM|nr:enoyl-CoA hydratase-related protein [Dyella acidisoli]GLQ91059.1 enoyl-CoA hydratase [Dyella acidisoli]
MPEIVTERLENILRIQFNRPEKKNAMTFNMYSTIAELLNAAAKDDETQVVLLHGVGDAFCAGNDLEDFLHHPLKGDDSPQGRFLAALIAFDKPLIAAVHGVAIGGGTTMLTHFDFVYAAEHTRFQMPFVNLALVPELGTSYWLPAQIGYLAAAELVLLAQPFDARRAAELGFVTRVVAEADLMATALDTAHKLTRQPAGAVCASKRLMRRTLSAQMAAVAELEFQEYASRLQSGDAKEAITAFLEKRKPDFTKSKAAAGGSLQ